MLGKFAPEIGKVAAALLAGGAACAAALFVAGVYTAVRGRLRQARELEDAPSPSPPPLVGRALRLVRITAIRFLAERSARLIPPRALDLLAGALRKAGQPYGLAAEEIAASMQVAAAFSFLFGCAVALHLQLSPLTPFAAAVLGAAYPLIWLRDQVRVRHHAITRALPYGLDLLTLSVEAGLDFAGAIGKVVEKGRRGPLADELGITLKALKLGKTREEALRELAARVDLPSLSSLVQALIQADRMGTPLGKVLRILSTQMRVERTQRAERLANEAPVKLLLPLIGCIFPTLFLMLFGPIAFQFFFGDGL